MQNEFLWVNTFCYEMLDLILDVISFKNVVVITFMSISSVIAFGWMAHNSADDK